MGIKAYLFQIKVRKQGPHRTGKLQKYVKIGIFNSNFYLVDFILYGEKGLKAIEVKLAHKIKPQDYKGLLEFLKAYSQATAFLLYTGKQSYVFKDIRVLPVEKFLKNKSAFL